VNVNKSDIAWVAIRILGIYLVVEGLTYALELATAVYAIYGPESVAWGANAADYVDKIITASVRVGGFLVLYLLAGLYCLLAGRFLHRIVMRAFDEAET
jgi:hypothetical protein